MRLLVEGTPWERYIIEDGTTSWPVWVKREDMCCPADDGPHFSKIRGVAAHILEIQRTKGEVPIGVLDTYHSKAGRGVAWLCNKLNMDCHVFYPVYKSERIESAPWTDDYIPNHHIREHQQVAARLGAWIHPLEAGRSCILYHQAQKLLAKITSNRGVMLPNGLKLSETVAATADEVWEYTPESLYCKGTWIVSISSGTIGAGVIRGLYYSEDYPNRATIVAHMGYSRSMDGARNYMEIMAGVETEDRLTLVDEGYAYKDKVDNSHIPFSCNEYYDAKAWNWLVEHVDKLDPPVVFWNIGA